MEEKTFLFLPEAHYNASFDLFFFWTNVFSLLFLFSDIFYLVLYFHLEIYFFQDLEMK